jgi:ankyrin repeat protein
MDYKKQYDDLFEYIKKKENNKFINNLNKIINEDASFDINITDTKGKHFLNYAVITNNVEIVEFLISKNARLDIENDEISILAITIFYSYNEMLKILLKADSENIGVGLVNYRDKNNKTPLHYAIISKNIFSINLLLENNANANIVDKDKYNALFYAVKSRSYDICKIIINYTSNINAKCQTGENVLMLPSPLVVF